MLKIYILEDEENILRYIRTILDEIPYVTVLGSAASVKKAQIEIPKESPDLILSDIQLKDGISLELLANLNLDTHIIFITAFNQYAMEALNLGAIGYLTKPIDPNLLVEKIEQCYKKTSEFKFNQLQLKIAENHLKHPSIPKKIALRTFEFTQIVNVEDILYCYSDKGYTTFNLKDGVSLMVSKVIKHFEAMLPPEQFIRCHQSYLINSHFIHKYYKDGQLEMRDGKKIPVSNRKREAIMQFIERLT
ncbi:MULTISPECIES: LytTR family DNA-binding domain-containing protein [unclassified Sphingobacterium]|uniref:LytR/AlgR family response regulator transcription factor n=1 Tax=unclassified Sphingobacterium TaxID=2609468 RepID=UPI00265D3587|nr:MULTISPECIES: LytTR family DNA-binding domain-containing protein [unclassified Sphingobacterium]WKK60030.1 LytTR family DNA-binding domain-containing protein [Sphingobacterium sp. BN32]